MTYQRIIDTKKAIQMCVISKNLDRDLTKHSINVIEDALHLVDESG
jgi:hypothetical protein